MADVYLARPRAQQRLVAIKVIKEKLAQKTAYVDMFVQEGNLAVLLNHDAIVKTYEIGRIHGRHFICMEYLPGVDLTLILRRCRGSSARRLPVPHSLYVVLRMCEGLHYAHELRDPEGKLLNVVNRDVSPSNVRVSFDGDIKLLDFGIAKATSSLSSEIGVLKGKFSHMSPEQVRGLPLDRRSDVFSCGIVLHETLTLEKLFRGDSDFQIMDLVGRAEVAPPSKGNPRVSKEIDSIAMRALQKEPRDRYQSAEEMAQDLRRALAKYNFHKNELRDLVRDFCRGEFESEQKTIQRCADVGTGPEPVQSEQADPTDEDYGVLVSVPVGNPQTARPATPRWIYGLLALTLGLLLVAVLLLIVL